jgi:hypothetical protein
MRSTPVPHLPALSPQAVLVGQSCSFLVQYQNDSTNYVPNNGMLLYEVHGVTYDKRFTIRAKFGLTHPRLTEFGPTVRDYHDDTFKSESRMRRDRDYLLVEKCPTTLSNRALMPLTPC